MPCLAVNVEIVSLGELPAQIDAFSTRQRPHAAFMRNDQRPDRIFTYRLSRSWGWGRWPSIFAASFQEWSPDDPIAGAGADDSPDGLEQNQKTWQIHGGDLEQMQPGLRCTFRLARLPARVSGQNSAGIY